MLVLTLVFYPMLGTLVAFTSMPSLVASGPIRALVMLLSIALIMGSRRTVWRNPRFRLILILWSLYFLRLLWDLFVAGIPVASEYMFNFVVFCVLSALALMHSPGINDKQLARLLLKYGAITCGLALLATFTNLTGERSFSDETQPRLFLETVNPITFGHVGVTTLIAAFAMSRYCRQTSDWLYVCAGALLGMLTIQAAGSRGPLVSLVLCVVALAALSKRHRWLLAPLAISLIAMFYGVSDSAENLIASRVLESAKSDSPEIRILMWIGAIQQFVDSPVLGSAIIELQFEDYPHNPLIEAAMALGVVGLGLMAAITFFMLKGIVNCLRGGMLMLPLLAVQYLSAAQFSGSLSSSHTFWMLLVLVTSTAVYVNPKALRRARRSTLRRQGVQNQALPNDAIGNDRRDQLSAST